jgi:MoCo/4Fe-4S cofactor protein with predicted Tat translocation signal
MNDRETLKVTKANMPPRERNAATEQLPAGALVALHTSGTPGQGLTLEEARAKLSGKGGKRYWRSLEELSNAPGFDEMLEREFPRQASEWIDPVSRRGFLKVMGASMALAGLSGCTKQPDEPIYPYIKQPEDLILGKPNYFASAHPFNTGAIPVLVKSDAYRPIKVDGNPDHPITRGSSDPLTQGTILSLYDPDRSQHVRHRGENREWSEFLQAFQTHLAVSKAAGGAGVYVLTGTVTSPTLAGQIKKAQAAWPNAKFLQYDPVNRDSAYAATAAAFGSPVDTQFWLEGADVIVSLDADFLSGITHPGFQKLAGDYSRRRKLDGASVEMNRLYAVESSTTTTGMKAEHRLGLRASDIPAFALTLAAAITGGQPPEGDSWSPEQQHFLEAVIKDLKASAGESAVIAGEQQPPEVHLAAIAINEALGNVGKTVIYTETVNPLPSQQNEDLKSLVADMRAGKVDWLLVLDGNPVYSAPADLDFIAALGKVKTLVHLGSHYDETGEIADWHINGSHYLESWSDARAYHGMVSIVQPMIDPLYGGKSAHEVIQAMLVDEPLVSPYEAVRATWKNQLSAKGDFEQNWRKALHDGFLEGTAFEPKTVAPKAGLPSLGQAVSADSIEVIFRPDPSLYDGRYANVGWLQELPKPITNLSWDNAALISNATLVQHKLEESEVIEIAVNGKKVRAAVLVVPGHPDNSITVYLGHGRRKAGRVGSGTGFDAYAIRSSSSPLVATGATITRTGDTYELASTKSHYHDDRSKTFGGVGGGTHSLEANEAGTRGIIRYATLDEFKKNPGFAHEGEGREDPEDDESMFPAYYYGNDSWGKKNAWGMSIDMNSCVGCNACVVACYAENNIAVVGKQQVKIGRNMQWLRIDTYFEGDLSAPRAHFQPMNCQHCENAPCEQVCPVGATVHTPEGVNTMVYNRCVGTRYCSNNCPYKVRRFNFLLYSDYETESYKLGRNPDVTVRSRGVMEKCSYCMQRIQAAKIHADKENREIRDGEVITACQQACPTEAIVFGNINDPDSKVAQLKKQQRTYGVLADLNTRPRTTYVAGVLNINPEFEQARVEHAPQGSNG